MKYMLDTDTCINLIRNKSEKTLKKVKEFIDDGIAVSSITLAELEHGVAKSGNPERNAKALTHLLITIDVLPFDVVSASEYGSLRTDLERNGNVIGPMDMLIAAHAKSENLIIVTNNTKEFTRVRGLTVENWT